MSGPASIGHRTPEPEWLAHLNREVAAISEGFCPTCSGRLLPVADNTGRCPRCGLWRAFTERDRREQGHDTWVAWTPPDRAELAAARQRRTKGAER